MIANTDLIQLDIAATPNEIDTVVDKVVAKYNLAQGTVVALKGPAGGWPLVEFKGATADIAQLQHDYDNGDNIE